MLESIIISVTVFSVIACSLVAGVFLAFSEFVTRSLDQSAKSGGIEAMQIINRKVYGTFFMVLLIGMAILTPILALFAWLQLEGATVSYTITGALIYVIVTFAVTLFGNVPLNKQLDIIDPNTKETASYWEQTFYPRWMYFNHIRTFGAVSASFCFLLACLSPGLV